MSNLAGLLLRTSGLAWPLIGGPMMGASSGPAATPYFPEPAPTPTPTPTPEPTPVPSMLLANPAPAEPAPKTFADGTNTGVYDVGQPDYDISWTAVKMEFAVQVSGTADGKSGIYIETLGPTRATIYTLDSAGAKSAIGYANYFSIPDMSTGNRAVRIRHISSRYDSDGTTVIPGTTSLYIDDMATPVKTVTGQDTRGVSTNVYIRRNSGSYTDAKVAILGNVTDRLVLSNFGVNSTTRLFSSDMDYYIPSADTFTFEATALSGETIIAAEDYTILSNDVAGKAKVRSKTTLPATKQGSRIRVTSRLKSNPASIVDAVEVTFPNPLVVGHNVSPLYEAIRSRRTTSNAAAQSYWQDPNAGYTTYRRNVPGCVDAKGYPLKTGLWLWLPLSDEQNVQQTWVIKWSEGDPNAVFARNPVQNQEGNGVVQMSDLVKVADRTYEWTMTCDRSKCAVLERMACLVLQSMDTANPIKGITVGIKGVDNMALWFRPEFIAEISRYPGRLRFLDDSGVNAVGDWLGKTFDFANRPKQGGICAEFTLECMLELCNRSNRPLHWCVLSAYIYEAGGPAFLRSAADLLYNGTGAQFFTAGFAAPSGMLKHIAPEVDNESWNATLGGVTNSYNYLARKAGDAGRAPPYDSQNGAQRAGASQIERAYATAQVMSIIEARISGWRARTIRILGCQFGLGDLLNVAGQSTWADAKLHIDEIARAPYNPADSNAGGRMADITDKSPAGVCAYLTRNWDTEVGPALDAVVAQTISYGFAHSIYEVNTSVPALGLTQAELQALVSSPEYGVYWGTKFLPGLAKSGGHAAMYKDNSGMYHYSIQQWGVEYIPGSIYNKARDEIVKFVTNNPVTVA